MYDNNLKNVHFQKIRRYPRVFSAIGECLLSATNSSPQTKKSPSPNGEGD